MFIFGSSPSRPILDSTVRFFAVQRNISVKALLWFARFLFGFMFTSNRGPMGSALAGAVSLQHQLIKSY